MENKEIGFKDARELDAEASEKSISRALGEIDVTRKLRKGEQLLKNKKHQKKLKEYYMHCKTQGQTIRTVRSKIRLLKYFCISIKNKDLKKVTRNDIEKFIMSKSNSSVGTINNYKIHIKSFYTWLYRYPKGKYPKIVNWIEKGKEKDNGHKEILTRKEVKLLLKNAPCLRDKCFISLLYDGALRVGEAVNIKIKDVHIDSYGIKISVNGKTGPRNIRLIESVPILKQWLNEHPFKENENYSLFISLARKYGCPLSTPGGYKIVSKSAVKSEINKRVYPHLFRHTKLTHLAADGFNEMELRIFAGWNKGSPMPEVYLHTREEDVDKKIRNKNGMVDKEEENKIKEDKENLKPKKCPMCSEINDVNNKFCFKCGQILDGKAAIELMRTNDTILEVAKNNKDLMESMIQAEMGKIMQKYEKLFHVKSVVLNPVN